MLIVLQESYPRKVQSSATRKSATDKKKIEYFWKRSRLSISNSLGCGYDSLSGSNQCLCSFFGGTLDQAYFRGVGVTEGSFADGETPADFVICDLLYLQPHANWLAGVGLRAPNFRLSPRP